MGSNVENRGEDKRRKRIAVIFGGCSNEYAVSLKSAYAVMTQMDAERYEVIPVGITRQGRWFLYGGALEAIPEDTWQVCPCIPAWMDVSREAHGLYVLRNGVRHGIAVDAVFPVLHGKNGEDGTVQGLAELAGIPCVGCGSLSSALCMDKDMAHRVVAERGIAVPRSVTVRRYGGEPVSACVDRAVAALQRESLAFPLFVKPARSGSSIGMSCLRAPTLNPQVLGKIELEQAIAQACLHDDKLVIEEGVPGYEVGCAVFGDAELTVGAVDALEVPSGFFDYEEKYTQAHARIHVPAPLDEGTSKRIRETAQAVYRALQCSGFARVDLFLRADGTPVFNEVNTIPGLTAHSRFPRMLKAAGIEFSTFLDRVIELEVWDEGRGSSR